jgi:hypothetical protein
MGWSDALPPDAAFELLTDASATGFEVRDEAGKAVPESVDSDDGWRSQTAHVRRAA